MASTVQVKEVLGRVSVLLLDASPQFTRWTESELVDWLNDAQMAITKYLPAACVRTDVIKLKPGTRQSIESIAAADCKPGDGSTPSGPILGKQIIDFIRNMGADGTSPGRVLRVVDRSTHDASIPNWHQLVGPSVGTVTYNQAVPRYFYVNPGVPPGGIWVEIAYTADPVRIVKPATPTSPSLYSVETGTSSALISVADEFVDDLTNYIAARANMKDGKESSRADATMYAGLFTGSLNSKVAALTGTNPGIKSLPGITG